ncbi:hypothetical protein SKAU_G00315630 [Synaphobranchus kaupii]|uniref:Uncharacterized protein n=1 Tax=Synaphobranchus kaupii TaxID=118154 RepID=A0A9Q1ESQ9_SYNKA|nr:hypothetical protein SKAU_G00315630 [Synaphobranchus kaupii]
MWTLNIQDPCNIPQITSLPSSLMSKFSDDTDVEPVVGKTLLSMKGEEAEQMHIDTALPEISSTASTPPPPPVHRRSSMPRELPQDDEDVVSETSDCSMVIRMVPQGHGEALLSVELGPNEVPGRGKTNEEGNHGA